MSGEGALSRFRDGASNWLPQSKVTLFMEIQQPRCAIPASGKAATLRPARVDVLRIFGVPVLVMALACAVLLGCAGERPQSATTPGLETGITSNNGGGERALGNQPNVGVTTRVGLAR
jgi:hypothetical protein